MVMDIRPELCGTCGLCVKCCPVQARALTFDGPAVDARRCVDCRCCAYLCPTGATRLPEHFQPRELWEPRAAAPVEAGVCGWA